MNKKKTNDQVYPNAGMSTQVNTSQHEATPV